jgi:hypothetical protein
LISRKGLSRQKYPGAVREHRVFCQGVEDQSSGKLTLHHPRGGEVFLPHQPSIRPSVTGHDPSMRTSSLVPDARALHQLIGLFASGQGHPRAALDMGDLRMAGVLPHHPGRSSACAHSWPESPPHPHDSHLMAKPLQQLHKTTGCCHRLRCPPAPANPERDTTAPPRHRR